MRVLEFKAKGKTTQYSAIDEAIRTAQFVRNKCVRYWMDNRGVGQKHLYRYNTKLRAEFPFVNALNSHACQVAVEWAYTSIARFYDNCRKSIPGNKGYPKFKKNCRCVEYKTCGWVRFVSSKNGESNFKVYEEQEFNLSYRLNTTLDNLMTMRVQVPHHRRSG